MKRLFSEFEDLKTSLPSDKRCSAWLRFDEETPQYIRAILPAPLPGPSPYSGGVFAFDIMIPDNYPNDPPKVQIITTGRGKVRFGPNLYACGKVCLSLIGTWSGPKWNPKASSLFQVLVSIQSLILGVEHPFFLEPGHGGWEEKIKEGEFTSVGNTLSGETVKEDLTLPSHAWVYEDQIRVATLRYAMLEPLTLVLKKNSTSNPALAHLLPFKDIMHLHFFHNGADTLQAVADWINASRPSTIGSRYKNDPSAPPSRQRDGSTKPYPIEFVNSMDTLYDQLEGLLKKLPPSSTLLNEETESNQSGDESMKPPPAENIDVSKETDLLDRRMKEAAESGNFILAGQIQKEIQEVESFDQKVADLNRQIQEAASKGDYVTAGELQANLKTFQSKAMNVASGSTSAQQMYPEDDEEMESAEDQFSDGDDSYDDGYDNDNYHRNKWGTGQRLNEITSQTSGSKDDAPAKISVSRLPVKDSRRLRIRLPSNSSIIEEFDGEEKLRTIYQVIKSHLPTKDTKKQHLARAKVVQVRGFSDALGNQKVGLCGGAFAAPLSEFGFTLLSAHPKREYSIEMDGLRTLKDLQIHTSAALTVMRCDERGMSLRGDLESKLAEAQGDAMDVDDLNYEALQELGEKIGVAAPGDGIKGLDQADLERISTLLSPNEFLSQKTTGDDDHDSRCCICLGEFDPDDTNKSLRILNHCGHCMHDSCLQTWLSTKTSCPVCKHSLND
ncbi:MAG: ubiquitin-protein ligase [Bacillariaceae sp.]